MNLTTTSYRPTGSTSGSYLLLTFDLTRAGEPHQALAAASLLANLRHAKQMPVDHITVNVLDDACRCSGFVRDLAERILSQDYQSIAISAYIWSDFLLKPLLRELRGRGYRGTIILGGYQASYPDQTILARVYPEADVFLKGYAEETLARAFELKRPEKPIVVSSVLTSEDFLKLPSPYLTGEILVSPGQPKVRLETKRGCPYKCTFCAFRNLTGKRTFKSEKERVKAEIELFHQRKVGKINVVDPVFNMTEADLEILEYMAELGLQAQVSLQIRPEMLKDLNKAQRFLDAASALKTTLEFGIQTMVEAESDAVKRDNKLESFPNLTQELNRRGIDYEVSLIYGLPLQTLDSFKNSMDYVKSLGIPRVMAFPLMLYPGTELFDEKVKFGIRERVMGDFDIPHVVSSNSFTEDDWWQMKTLADDLDGKPERIAAA